MPVVQTPAQVQGANHMQPLTALHGVFTSPLENLSWLWIISAAVQLYMSSG